MNRPNRPPQSPNETLGQLSRYSKEPDKSGQHNAGCLFVNRGSEPWPNKYINCHENFKTFQGVITHIEDSGCLEPRMRHYTCPACHKKAQVPAAVESPGKKVMLKLTKSMHSIRDQISPQSLPSSPGFSPTAASLSSNLSLTHAQELAAITSYCAEKPTCNPQDLGLSAKQDMMGSIKIDTQLHQPPPHNLYCELSGLTPATTSSYRSELQTPYSAHELSSASHFLHNMATPLESPWNELPGSDGPNGFPYADITRTPSDGQHLQYGGFNHQPLVSGLQDQAMFQECEPLLKQGDFLLEGTTNIQQGGANMEGMPGFLSNCNPRFDHPDIQQWEDQIVENYFQSQPGSTFTNLHVGHIAGHQVLTPTTDSDADFSFTSPTSPTSCANMSMAETLVASAGNPSPSSPTSTAAFGGQSCASPSPSLSSPSCPKCDWSPDTTAVYRSPSKLQQAVKKHFKRNHESPDFPCPAPACSQSFRNRLDNVKPHVKRKHPEMFRKLYGQKRKTAAAAQSQPQDQSWSPADEGRAGGNTEAPVGKPAAGKRGGRHARAPRGFARPEDQF